MELVAQVWVTVAASIYRQRITPVELRRILSKHCVEDLQNVDDVLQTLSNDLRTVFAEDAELKQFDSYSRGFHLPVEQAWDRQAVQPS